MEGHLKIPVLLLVAGLTLSCTAEEEAPVPDSGNNKEASVPGCGENKVHASADCTSRCAAPCRCITVMSSPGMSNFPKACLRSCKEPWDCPGTERCGYYDGALVCVPEYLSVPKGTYHVSANVDCFSSPGRTYDGCRGKDLVQTQTFGFKGLFKGAMCTSMLQRRCPGSCVSPDQGIARCSGPDAGIPPAPDLGAGKVHCCPYGSSFGFYRWHHRGGAKVPPNACRLVHCPSYACPDWVKTTDSYGCKVMRRKAKDAGVDGG